MEKDNNNFSWDEENRKLKERIGSSDADLLSDGDFDFSFFGGYDVNQQRQAKSYNPHISNEDIKRARSNSVGPKRATQFKPKKSPKKEGTSKKIAKAVFSVCLAAAMIAGGVKVASDVREKISINDALDEYRPAISSCMDIDIISGDMKFDFDSDKMGKIVADSEDPELALFAVYNEIKEGYNSHTHVLNTYKYAVDSMKQKPVQKQREIFGGYDTLNEYFESMGCVDKDGSLNFDKYGDTMEARLLAQESVKDSESKVQLDSDNVK